MREYHVFFMYYAYDLFAPFAKYIKNGPLLMETMAHLILGLNLVKGFSMEVRLITGIYFLSAICIHVLANAPIKYIVFF